MKYIKAAFLPLFYCKKYKILNILTVYIKYIELFLYNNPSTLKIAEYFLKILLNDIVKFCIT